MASNRTNRKRSLPPRRAAFPASRTPAGLYRLPSEGLREALRRLERQGREREEA